MNYRQQWEKHNSSINTLKNNAIYCIVEQNPLKIEQYSNCKKLDSISDQSIINKYSLVNVTDSQSKILFDVGLKSSMICFDTELTPLFHCRPRIMYDNFVNISCETRHILLNSAQLCKNIKNFELDFIYKKTAKSSELLHVRKLSINPKVSIVKIINLEIFGEHYFILPKILSFKVGKKQTWPAIWKKFVLGDIVRGFLLNPVKGGYAVAICKSIAFLPKSLRLECDERIGEYRFFKILSMRPDIKNIVVKEV